jgi:hypothetical protein
MVSFSVKYAQVVAASGFPDSQIPTPSFPVLMQWEMSSAPGRTPLSAFGEGFGYHKDPPTSDLEPDHDRGFHVRIRTPGEVWICPIESRDPIQELRPCLDWGLGIILCYRIYVDNRLEKIPNASRNYTATRHISEAHPGFISPLLKFR